MRLSIAADLFRRFGLILLLATLWQAQAQDSKTTYSSMPPLDQYLMERNAEIDLARTAAPPSISQDAQVMVFGKHGYENAVSGKNGFVCLVMRGWTAAFTDPVFSDPTIRGPVCLNPAAVRSFLPVVLRKAEMVAAGRSKEQMAHSITAALSTKELPPIEPGAMSFMLSRQGNLGNGIGSWHPHLMFFTPLSEAGTWGGGLPGSPIIEAKDETAQVITFLIPVRKWSDGTFDVPEKH